VERIQFRYERCEKWKVKTHDLRLRSLRPVIPGPNPGIQVCIEVLRSSQFSWFGERFDTFEKKSVTHDNRDWTVHFVEGAQNGEDDRICRRDIVSDALAEMDGGELLETTKLAESRISNRRNEGNRRRGESW